MVGGYKISEVGLIPNDWSARPLNDLIRLKSGFAFSSQFYSDSGPILLTPGNFKLEGGLYFEDRNTKRYCGPYSTSVIFQYGDLLVVMTDLTPECNLLGKPAIVMLKEKILHNQRIGKIEIQKKELLKSYLYWIFLSKNYLSRIKETSTGSTVRHTSNGSIYGTFIPLPPTIAEQTAIATALNDADALITQLEKLIAKKRAIKQGAMQELLKPKEGWVNIPLNEVVEFSNGKAHEQFIDEKGEYIVVNSKFVSTEGNVVKHSNHNITPLFRGDIAIVMSDIPNGKALAKCFLIKVDNKYTLNQRIGSITPKEGSSKYYYYQLNRNKYFLAFDSGSGQTNLRKNDVLECPIALPRTLLEQTRIAQILSDMDTEIEILEKKSEKYKKIKQGMMQELLTGRIRLV